MREPLARSRETYATGPTFPLTPAYNFTQSLCPWKTHTCDFSVSKPPTNRIASGFTNWSAKSTASSKRKKPADKPCAEARSGPACKIEQSEMCDDCYNSDSMSSEVEEISKAFWKLFPTPPPSLPLMPAVAIPTNQHLPTEPEPKR